MAVRYDFAEELRYVRNNAHKKLHASIRALNWLVAVDGDLTNDHNEELVAIVARLVDAKERLKKVLDR